MKFAPVHLAPLLSEIGELPEVQDLVAGYVEELNKRLNRWETIKKFALLDHDLTQETGELTPTLKLKRNVVNERYEDVFESLYAN